MILIKNRAAFGDEEPEDPRRRELVRALASGALLGGGVGAVPAAAAFDLFGRRPAKMRPEKSFYQMEGGVRVNGRAAGADTVIGPNDHIEVPSGGKAVFTVGKDAFMLRGGSDLKLTGRERLVNSMRLLTGKLLTVFGRPSHRMTTSTATIGIRGTGVYVEAEPDLTYLCTCYGTTQFSPVDVPSEQETVTSTTHGNPRYIVSEPEGGSRIIPAPFKNHTDLELAVLEGIVDRAPPFRLSGGSYRVPRRDDAY